MTSNKLLSNLELVTRVDSWPYYQRDPDEYRRFMSDFYYFMIEGWTTPFGYVHSRFINELSWPRSSWAVDHGRRTLTLAQRDSFDERTKLVEKTLRQSLEKGLGEVHTLPKWCNELFPVYAADGAHVLDMDGCGMGPFGVINFSVHMTAFVNTPDGLRFWVPRRAKTKRTYPGMLDNTVGGSLASREQPIDCIVRECAEEASLSPEWTRSHIKPCGTLSYQMTQTDDGQPGCQHQVQYVYELEVTEDMQLIPCDGEVEEFRLMSLEEVQAALARGEFKLNCAMTWMAYFIRNGFIHAENEKNLTEICARLHRKHDLFMV